MFVLPLDDRIEPELREFERTGILGARHLDDIGAVREVVEALANVSSVQRATSRVAHVVKQRSHKDPLVADVRRRLGKAGVVHIVRGPPRAISPVGAGFENVVLEIILMEQNQPAFIAKRRKLPQPRPIPWIELGQIILAEAIPGCAAPASREGLFE